MGKTSKPRTQHRHIVVNVQDHNDSVTCIYVIILYMSYEDSCHMLCMYKALHCTLFVLRNEYVKVSKIIYLLLHDVYLKINVAKIYLSARWDNCVYDVTCKLSALKSKSKSKP